MVDTQIREFFGFLELRAHQIGATPIFPVEDLGTPSDSNLLLVFRLLRILAALFLTGIILVALEVWGNFTRNGVRMEDTPSKTKTTMENNHLKMYLDYWKFGDFPSSRAC